MREPVSTISTEKRSTPSTWDLLRTGFSDVGFDTDAGVFVSPYLAENLSTVFSCVQVIAETVAMLPLHVYRKLADGDRAADHAHPVAQIFSMDPNERQTATEFIE
jgi:phage portal protein BeeE